MRRRWLASVWLGLNCLSTFILVVVAMPPSRGPISELLDDDIRDEIEAMKERILSELGLAQVPDISRVNVSREQMSSMLELYHQSVRETELEESEEEQEHKLLTFYSYSPSAPSNTGSENTMVSKRLIFSLQTSSFLRQTQTRVNIQSAKLRIPGLPGGQKPRIVIYRLMNSSAGRESAVLVTNQFSTSESLHSVELDVTDAVNQWIHKPKRPFELLMECRNCSDHGSPIKNNSEVIQEPAVLEVLVSETPLRVRRSKHIGVNLSNVTFLDCTKGFRTKMCCRRSLKVSFKEIGWDWIVQPTEFESFFCKGRCHYKFNSFVTTHALMQSILHSKGRKVPKPCCAPKKLRALNLLHYNDNDPPQLIVTRQKGMIVKDCACL